MSDVSSLVNKFEKLAAPDIVPPCPQRVRVTRRTMPLRQSTLKFTAAPAAISEKRGFTEVTTTTKSTQQLTPTTEKPGFDTIVVDTTEMSRRTQLPTPSESATDVSSQASSTPNLKRVRLSPRSRTKRVSISQRKNDGGRVYASSPAPANQDKLRNISGETLIEETSMSHSTLLKDGIDALNLTWNMSNIFDRQSMDEDIEQQSGEGSTIEVAVDEVSLEEKQQQQELKHAKIAENKKKWEQKQKAAEKHATRRSKRASILLTKANTVVSSITSSVLGKRTHDSIANSREVENTKEAQQQELDAKKPHLAAPNAVADENTLSSAARAIRSRAAKEKKWLTSGLYAGQTRTFNPAITESKNKRKSTTVSTDEKSTSAVRENSLLPMPMFAGARLLATGRDFKLPFDVYSPLPAGQPKPDEWQKVNRNVFIGDAADQWRWNRDYLEHSTCVCKASTGCDHNCMNRFMYYECDSRNCNLTEEQCGNRAFEGLRQRVKKGGKYMVGVEVIKTKDRGYGVRSNRTFEPNQIIVEYTGEIINQEECEGRMRGVYKDNECYYLMAFDQNMIIDATRGSIARFVNHSCDPNCRMEKWTVGNKPRMALFAGDRGIMTGEELTYDYNFDPYSLKNVQECRCGSENCRGVLGPKPKDVPKRLSPSDTVEKESKVKSVKRKITEVLEENNLLPKNNKRRKTMEPAGKPTPSDASRRKTLSSNDETLNRQPSKLQRSSSEKSKSESKRTSSKSTGRSNQRKVSTDSESKLIIRAENGDGEAEQLQDEQGISSIAALKAKADNIRRNVKRTLRSNR